jgi:hypothetical protein
MTDERRRTERSAEEAALPPFNEVGYREGMDTEHGMIDEPTPDETSGESENEPGSDTATDTD